MPATTALTLRGTPPFLIGGGLLFWGWQCGFMMYAAPMALLLEYAGYSRWRVNLTGKEFNHVSDLSSMILLVTVVYLFTVRSYHAIYTILALLPFLFFLLILTQRYSVPGKIKLSALFLSLRKAGSSGTQDLEIDLSFPYLLVCIISASTGNHHPAQFYLLLILILAWSLWALRPPHTRPAAWLLLFAISAAAGYGGQFGILKIRSLLEESWLGWFESFMWRSRDPSRNTTAIGSLGRFKLSDRIVVRVDTHGEELTGRILLREATYTDYGYGVWTNFQNTFALVDPAADGKSWTIKKLRGNTNRYTVSFYLDDDRAVIPAPYGLNSITNISAIGVEASAFGTIMLELHPGWIRYDTLYSKETLYDAEPLKEDLAIPIIYKDDLQRLVDELRLGGKPPAQALAGIEGFFADHFTYTLNQGGRFPRGKYLSRFLFETRQGHCEYFATATVLLLRAAGIPARYALGYSIDEYSPLERQYIGRASHAHSWAQAYINNAWRVVDTTPPVWAALEESDKSTFQGLLDLWSWAAYLIVTGPSSEMVETRSIALMLLTASFLMYLIWRVLLRKRLKKSAALLPAVTPSGRQGADSSFYRLMSQLENKYSPRRPAETLLQWILHIEKKHGLQGLMPLIALHYRARFDPQGLDTMEKKQLDELVRLKLE
jgi:Transglutaminase-like enzymes, putative cysteine proteases